MHSLDPEVAITADYDRLRIQLVETGFERVSSDRWRGPIFECFKSLAPDQESMEIKILDGYPYRHPRIFVDGIVGPHVNTNHEVCLWGADEESLVGRSLGDLEARSREWVDAHSEGFRPEDEVLDAHLYFEERRYGVIAVGDLASFEPSGSNETGSLWGQWENENTVLRLSGSRQGMTDPVVKGSAYLSGRTVSVPPQDLDGFRAALTAGQETNFERRIEHARRGESRVVALLWDTDSGARNVLALLLSPSGQGDVKAEALEVAPTDLDYLLLRAGPDAADLQDKRAAIFGLGAVGSHMAVSLGQSGFGAETLIDDAYLRPADFTRYRGLPREAIKKVKSTALAVALHAPWVSVEHVIEAPWKPSRIQELIADAAIVIDATGSTQFTELLSIEAEKANVRLVSAALHRQGSVSRIRRQAAGDTPIAYRTDEARYPVIPPPPGGEPVRLEPGCAAPVNNASPVQTLRVAADAAQMAIDTVLGRLSGPDEVIEVYAPLEAAPFDQVGVVGGDG